MAKKSTYLLIGTNMGQRDANLQLATELLEKQVGKLTKSSSIYETAAWGKENQPGFLNQVLAFETNLKPAELLEKILQIEQQMGRQRLEKWGSRIIDIDILYFNEKIINQKNLQIPHPYLQDRRFTMVPLAEIAPDFTHPVLKKNNKQLLEICEDRLEVNPFEK